MSNALLQLVPTHRFNPNKTNSKVLLSKCSLEIFLALFLPDHLYTLHITKITLILLNKKRKLPDIFSEYYEFIKMTQFMTIKLNNKKNYEILHL